MLIPPVQDWLNTIFFVNSEIFGVQIWRGKNLLITTNFKLFQSGVKKLFKLKHSFSQFLQVLYDITMLLTKYFHILNYLQTLKMIFSKTFLSCKFNLKCKDQNLAETFTNFWEINILSIAGDTLVQYHKMKKCKPIKGHHEPLHLQKPEAVVDPPEETPPLGKIHPFLNTPFGSQKLLTQ